MLDKCYIITTRKRCNCDCDFCISKVRNYEKEEEFLKVNDNFINNLELLKKRGVKVFEITGGGEPFLNCNLDVLISVIKKIIPEAYVKIYTNGNILREVAYIDEINISVVHYCDTVNASFMNPKYCVSLMEKLKFFREFNKNAKIRLSVPLIKGGIDSERELRELVSLTEDYVDEYVVRTLYPGCNDYDKLHVDFVFEHEKVKFERDNTVSDFNGIIMWSDGNLYKDWNIEGKRHLYSYLLLKPDARTYVREIENLIGESGLRVIDRKILEDFVNESLNLYKDKSVDYLKHVRIHLENAAYLFGNKGLVYVLDGFLSLEELQMKTLELKAKIRELYSFSGFKNSFVSTENLLYQLNLVHSPDNYECYQRDLSVIESLGCSSLTDIEFSRVLKYRSFDI